MNLIWINGYSISRPSNKITSMFLQIFPFTIELSLISIDLMPDFLYFNSFCDFPYNNINKFFIAFENICIKMSLFLFY